MLIYKDHSLQLLNVSFYFPDNFMFNITYDGLVPEKIILLPLDVSNFDIMIHFIQKDVDTRQAVDDLLQRLNDEEDRRLTEAGKAVTCGDFRGYRVEYQIRNISFEEYYFDIPNNEIYGALHVYIGTDVNPTDEGIAYRNKTITQLLSSLRITSHP